MLRDQKEIIDAPIKGQCYRVNGYKRQQIEDDLCRKEGVHAEFLKAIGKSDCTFCFSKEERETARDFVALSYTRNVHRAGDIKKALELMGEILGEGELQRQFQQSTNEYDSVLTSLSFYKPTLEFISDLGMVVLSNDTETGFITSDNPVVAYNIAAQSLRGASHRGAQSAGVILYVPVSTYKALLLYDKTIYQVFTTNGCVVPITDIQSVNQLNSMIVVNSAQCLYADKSQLNTAIVIGKRYASRREQRQMVITQSANKHDERRHLLHTYEFFPDLGINLPFVRIKRIKNIEKALRGRRGKPPPIYHPTGSKTTLYSIIDEKRADL